MHGSQRSPITANLGTQASRLLVQAEHCSSSSNNEHNIYENENENENENEIEIEIEIEIEDIYLNFVNATLVVALH